MEWNRSNKLKSRYHISDNKILVTKEEEKDIKTSDKTKDHHHKNNLQWLKTEWINFLNNGS